MRDGRAAGLVVLGGALGTSARAGLEAAFPPTVGGWPWTTFAINVVGSLLLGVLLGALQASGPDDGWRRRVRVLVGTGVVGGFTTYSTFALEVDRLVGAGHGALAVAYALVSVVLGVVAAGAGILLAGTLGRGRAAGRG
ncbi:CrcB family protein [Cellulosimicrobium sp. Marseille-Q8652]